MRKEVFFVPSVLISAPARSPGRRLKLLLRV
ncbi:hypothetical protein LINPERHAP1_LOCUS35131 [Linum perenne]